MAGLLSLSGAQLYGISQEVGRAAATLHQEGSLAALGPLLETVGPLSGGPLLAGRETVRLQKAHTHPRRFSPAAAQLLLSRLEGRILGELVRRDALPEEARDLFARRLAGRVPISTEDIEEAHRRVRASWILGFSRHAGLQPSGFPRHVRRTRLVPFPALSEELGRPVFLKLESEQPVGSFKNRGATNFLINALLAGKDPRKIRVGTASHGNHAQGVVRAAHNLGIRNVQVLLPVNASPLKIAQLKALGAEVELFGETFEEAEEEMRRRAAGNPDYLFLPAFDHPLVVAGQGTMGVEIFSQMAIRGHPGFAVAAPAGGGGLLAGLGTYLGPRGIPVLGAESETHPYISRSFHASREAGALEIVEAADIRHIDTVADGIALLRPGRVGLANIVRHVAYVTALPESEIEAALLYLKGNDIEAEGAAAVPIAALLFGALPLQKLGIPDDLPVVSVVSGKNIDETLLKQIEDRAHRRSWHHLRSEFTAMLEDLEKAGYLEDGTVRTLVDFPDAKAFIDRLAAHLPKGWDPLDAFERLHFGPWRPDGAKDINATLRSLGAFQERWGGDKGLSVIHALGNRGVSMVVGMGLLEGEKVTLSELEEQLELAPRYPRLLAETYVVDLLLARPAWLKRLWPRANEQAFVRNARDLAATNEEVKAALRKYAAANAFPGGSNAAECEKN